MVSQTITLNMQPRLQWIGLNQSMLKSSQSQDLNPIMHLKQYSKTNITDTSSKVTELELHNDKNARLLQSLNLQIGIRLVALNNEYS